MSVDEYLQQLTDKERLAYEIAVKILGTSFDVSKSSGYLKKKNIPLS
jgi:hypothetical protein